MAGIRNNIRILLLAGSCLVLTGVFLYLFYAHGSVAIGPAQPIPFSHRLHVGVKQIQCKYCHPYVSNSNFPGIPPVEKCLHCHKYIIPEHPWIQEEHRYFNTKTPTPWKKVNYIPEHVLFNHQRHINSEIACEQCHGEIKTMDRLKGVRFQMGFCITCHEEKKANVDCWLSCHS